MLYGYVRVVSIDQDLSGQVIALKAAGCIVIRSEKTSGIRHEGRNGPDTLLKVLRKGDTPVVLRSRPTACSIAAFQDIVKALKAKGAAQWGQVLARHAWHIRRFRDEAGTRAPV